jgi:hypothetical protein
MEKLPPHPFHDEGATVSTLLRGLFAGLFLMALLTASLRLPSASADPDPTPEPTPSPSPTSEPSPDPEPTETPTPSPPPGEGGGDPTPSPSPSPSPDDDQKGKDPDRQTGEREQRERKKSKKDPFTMRGPRNTAKLISILTAVPPSEMSLKEALMKVVGPFPVAGLAWWTQDWHAPRCCPFPHLHQGLDIFAPSGTPLVAAADGYISQKVNSPPASGLGLEITDAKNIQYFYAHLSAFEPGIEVGTEVELGQVIGYVGNTGNARGTMPHLHFERQPDGVPAPPKPWVDRWLKVAERKALALVQELTGKKPKVERLTFRLTRLFDLVDTERTDLDDLATGATGETVVSGELNPAPTYHVARHAAGNMAWEIDWGEEAADQIATGIQAYQREMTDLTLMGIVQDWEAEHTEFHASTGMLPESFGATVAEGIGDPTVPLVTDAGSVDILPAGPGSVGDFTGTDAEDGLPIGAPGAVIGSSSEIAEASTDFSASTLADPASRSSSWRTAVGAALVRVLAVYGGFSTRLPDLMETLRDEIVAGCRRRMPCGALRETETP